MENLSAFELAEKIKTQSLSSYEVVQKKIAQIKKLNPQVLALVEDRFAEALEQAKQVDLKIKQQDPQVLSQPLAGVPCTIKEMFSVNGFKSTLGSIPRKDHREQYDADVVHAVKQAGAIILGTTNVPELGFWFECDNTVYGKTSNPHDLTRTSGGSSGGEAAILAMHGSYFGIGSDIGGSIRIPAAFCGVYGHKPSEKLIPFTGHYPVTQENVDSMAGEKYPFTVLGPMTNTARDLRPLTELLMSVETRDPLVRKNFKLSAPVKDWSQITVYSWANPNFFMARKADRELQEAVQKGVEHFRKLGAQVRELDPKIFHKAFDIWSGRAVQRELPYPTFREALSNRQPLNYALEFFKMAIGKRKYTLPALLTALLEDISHSDSYKKKLVKVWQEAVELSHKQFAENSLIICPAHSRVAPKHGATITSPFDFCYTGIFNALNFPASVVPVGFNSNKLPVAVQLAAPTDQDHICLSAAEELDKVTL